MDRLIERKQKSTFVFLVFYLFVIVFIAYFYNSISTLSQKKLYSNSNKLQGVQYLKLLQTLGSYKIDNSEEAITLEKFNVHIEKTLKYLKKHPQLNSNNFEKYLTTELKNNSKASSNYDFFDILNAENYITGSRSGLLFSKSKEDYFLATLMTHYLPEFLASINIVEAILEEYIEKNYLGEESKKYLVENKKLINLSLSEVSSIVSLLEDYEDSKEFHKILVSLTQKINKFTLDGLVLPNPRKELLANHEIIHSARNDVNKLNSINSF